MAGLRPCPTLLRWLQRAGSVAALLAANAVLEANGFELVASPEGKENTLVAVAVRELSLEGFAQWLEDHAVPALSNP